MSSPTSRAGGVRVFLFVGLTIGCGQDPYKDLKNETVGLGAVDPVNFPAENLGQDGNRMQPGSGTFLEISAFAGGQTIGYFAYPVKTAAMRDPLRLIENGKPYAAVPTPTAYAFDATDEAPVPAKNRCSPPAGYKPDKRLDPIEGWYERQGNVFTDLPKATYNPGVASSSTYVPVVAEARVSSNGRVCQEFKSEKGISISRAGGKLPATSGRFLAWLIIDPAASVFAFDDADQTPATSIVLQKWGWYSRYMVAYLDGGYVPTEAVDVGTMDMPLPITRMIPQKLYYPRQIAVMDPMTMMPAAAPGKRGDGYDVLTAARGMPGYSPICEVVTYATAPAAMPPAPPALPLPVEMLPKDAAAIEMTYAMTFMPGSPRYVYCLQVR
ncbi:MAG TPA: hypothetical protein VN914_05085 [Polyangia bacterium]|nr:hypothetical protein [Polyangia bacterium]